MATIPGASRSLLVVDDEPHVRSLVRLVASAAGISSVVEAEDGERAVQLHRRLRPDLVFMDIHMPRLDGVTALKAMRLIDRQVHVVMLTSVNATEVVRQCIDAGADGYILKDVPAPMLAQEITRAIVEALASQDAASGASKDAAKASPDEPPGGTPGRSAV
jgi:DNA-binding NarL/FixJ family response regulator